MNMKGYSNSSDTHANIQHANSLASSCFSRSGHDGTDDSVVFQWLENAVN